MKICWTTGIAVLLLAGLTHAQKLSTEPVISDAEIRALLTERIDQKKQSVGIVVGVIEDRGERIVSYGALNQNDPRPLSGSTLFEIGSVTDVFTALLLSDMVRHGEVALNDPLAKYLPAYVKLPSQAGRPITLADLATHTAGLPLLPPNFHPKNPANPYLDYSENELLASLAGYKLAGTLGTDYNFSNLGMGLLGWALARRAGQNYEALLKTRILDPLGMKNSAITLTPALKGQLAVGHNKLLQPVAYWDVPALPGALGMKASVQDLLTFLETELGYRPSPLAASLSDMLNLRRPTHYPGLELALGWHILTTSKTQILWHNGGTGGFRAFLGFSPRAKVGIVVLSNTGSSAGIDDLGLRLFSSTPPDLYFLREHTEIKVDPRIFANYIGQYQLPDGMLLAITLNGDHLQAQLGQQKFQLAAESNKDFFVKSMEGQLTFVTDRSGIAYLAVLHQAGTDLPAKRIF